MSVPDFLASLADAVTDAVARSDRAKKTGSTWKFRCPYPDHEDNNPDAEWNPEKGVWCCHARHCEKQVEGGGGTLGLARLLGIDETTYRIGAPPLIRVETGKDEHSAGRDVAPPDRGAFAAERGLNEAELRDKWGVVATVFRNRPALRYPTSIGRDRIKFVDGANPKYTWASAGGGAHLYGLDAAVERLATGNPVLYIINGEPSVWGADLHGVAAVCTCVGEVATKAAAALADDLKKRVGATPVRVVFDADPAGRKGGLALVAALSAAGLDAKALDLSAVPWPGGPPKGADVGDLARDVRGNLAAALAALPEVAEPASDGRLPPGSILLADVVPEQLQWLWPGWVPLGSLTIVDGDPGLGKSTLTLDLAARVSRGSAMPDGSLGDVVGPRGVVIMTAEDGLAVTVRPRLDAASADCTRIVSIQATGEGDDAPMPTLADIATVRRNIAAVDAALVIVDPLMAYVPAETNSYKDQDVRRILAPLARLAAETGVAIVLVRHLNKSGGGHAIYRGGGSIGIVGAARSGLLVAVDPSDDSRRVLASMKSNLALSPESMFYRVVSADTGVGRIEWEGASLLTADELMAVPNSEERSSLREAEAFLRDILAGGPMAAKDVQREARDAGIAERTLRRARESLGVIPTRRENRSEWSLPAGQVGQLTAGQAVGERDADEGDGGDVANLATLNMGADAPDTSDAANLSNLASQQRHGQVGQLELGQADLGVEGVRVEAELAIAPGHGQVGQVGQVPSANSKDLGPPDWMDGESAVGDAYAAAAAHQADADGDVAHFLLADALSQQPDMDVGMLWEDCSAGHDFVHGVCMQCGQEDGG